MTAAPDLISQWAKLYSDQKALSTGVTFVHLGGVLLGGGFAVVADRISLRVAPRAGPGLPPALEGLGRVHRWVLGGLALTLVTGLLMLFADLDTYLPSVVFWTKMALIALLLVNGYARARAESAIVAGQAAGWRRLRLTSGLSLGLWFAVLLLGTMLTALS